MPDNILKELKELLLHKENKKRGPINTTGAAGISEKDEIKPKPKPKAAMKMDHNILIFHDLKSIEASTRSQEKLEKNLLKGYKEARESRGEKDWKPKLEDYQKSKPSLKGTNFVSANTTD